MHANAHLRTTIVYTLRAYDALPYIHTHRCAPTRRVRTLRALYLGCRAALRQDRTTHYPLKLTVDTTHQIDYSI